MSKMVQALFYSLKIHYTKPIQDLFFKELIFSLSANEADVIKKKKKKNQKKCAVSFTQRENKAERRNVVVLPLNGKHAVLRGVMVDL